ncbi:type IV secretion system protein VirB10 [Sphingomonas zeicaulis]|uniref:TrbI/VirB10 family protein n=1 Tax=Sphingomonas zeicaulis TaxID=1632740 RepID=UPI003D1CA8EF
MSEVAANTSPATPKVDPETLVLRGAPARTVRFRKGVIIGLAALGSTTLAGVAWLALQPATIGLASRSDDEQQRGRDAAADVLADAPGTYGDVPRLGPPLPGDLGRPIVARQRKRADEGVAPAGDAAAQAAEAERQRRLADERAARASALLVGLKQTAEPRAAEAGSAASSAAEPEVADLRSAAAGKVAFLERRYDGGDVNPHMLLPPASADMLSAGTVIAASLMTGLNSDVPGIVIAQVTQNTYDSATGRRLLVPQGSRLIGKYDSDVSFGQERALIVWQRLMFPDGSSVRIDNAPASDMAGYAGLADRLDRHGGQLLKGVALSTLLGVGTELSIDGDDDLVSAVRRSAQQGAARAGDQLVGRSLDIPPTIRVRPGWPLTVIVHADLVLRPWRADRAM